MSQQIRHALTLLCILGISCGDNDSYGDFVKPALSRGLNFGYVYKDMSPEHAGLVFYSGRSEKDSLPRQELTLRISGLLKGDYAVQASLRPSEPGGTQKLAQIEIATRYDQADGSPRRAPLRILEGKVTLLEDGPGLGVWSTDGTSLPLAFDLIVNRKRYSPIHCEGSSDKVAKRSHVRCNCVNALKEERDCDHDFSVELDEEGLDRAEQECCDQIGLFPAENETLRFEHSASFGKDFCEDLAGVRAAHIYCNPRS